MAEADDGFGVLVHLCPGVPENLTPLGRVHSQAGFGQNVQRALVHLRPLVFGKNLQHRSHSLPPW